MKITNKYKMSQWAYEQCLDNDDDIPEIRNLITDSYHSYLYCRFVKDRKDMMIKITNSNDACAYCKFVKDLKKMRDLITNEEDIFEYCQCVKDRKSMWRKLIKSRERNK